MAYPWISDATPIVTMAIPIHPMITMGMAGMSKLMTAPEKPMIMATVAIPFLDSCCFLYSQNPALIATASPMMRMIHVVLRYP